MSKWCFNNIKTFYHFHSKSCYEYLTRYLSIFVVVTTRFLANRFYRLLQDNFSFLADCTTEEDVMVTIKATPRMTLSSQLLEWIDSSQNYKKVFYNFISKSLIFLFTLFYYFVQHGNQFRKPLAKTNILKHIRLH